MDKKSLIRDIIMVLLMLGAALYVFTHPAEKQSPEEKINLSSLIPAAFNDWISKTYDTSDYKDKWQSINELLVRDYYEKGKGRRLGFILEYSSDLRKNFSLHFPEICHRSGGNEVIFLEPLEIDLGNGKTIKAKCLYIKGIEEGIDKIVVYWLTIDNKQYYRTFFIKLDQMLSGLLKKSKRGFLVRVDYSEDVEYTEKCIENARKVIANFIKDLYNTLLTTHSTPGVELEMLFGRNTE
ncbi:MAG: EpsI family protein [Candidatus Aureabacteria bacterium]|nr:EpsI family protein [Candidatus Auribacterota bacterium]